MASVEPRSTTIENALALLRVSRSQLQALIDANYVLLDHSSFATRVDSIELEKLLANPPEILVNMRIAHTQLELSFDGNELWKT